MKEILKHFDLPTGGKKNELKSRILTSIPLPPYLPIAKSYEWDTLTNKNKYKIMKAKTGRSNCVRCLTPIDQSRTIVVKDTWDPIKRIPIDRKYHIECFCKFPPNEINIFEDIQWDESSINSLIPIAGNLFLEYHPKDQELEPRETMEQFKGMREVSKSLQQEGYTGTQALQILKQFQE
jgi:hypothetical protein